MTEPVALHVVLVEPEIPWNTGNVGRTCLAAGASLHLVRPLGFRLDERRVRRAGLDYWQHVAPTVWHSWPALEPVLAAGELGAPWFFSAEGERTLWQIDLARPAALVFGSETTGLPEAIRDAYRERTVRLPMADGPVRSLNLSTAVAVALFEALRQRQTRRQLSGAASTGMSSSEVPGTGTMTPMT